MNSTYSVLILDMFHYQDPEHEYQIDGFPTLELAREFARRWVRDSVEEFRQPNQDEKSLRELWYTFGEDAMVIGGDYAGSLELDFFIKHVATDQERDWKSLQNEAGTG